MNKLMSHLIANYPSPELSFDVASALVEGGASILEVQLPFSDPSADGPAIQKACSEVLTNGTTTAEGLALIEKVHKAYPEVTIYIMSYGSLIYTPGVENFCKKASEAGVKGLIIPDLPFDHDEGLTAACKKYGMDNIPVAAPGMSDERLEKMHELKFPYIYVALRAGITGSKTTIDDATLNFIKKVSKGGEKLFGGFGIEEKEQADAIGPYVDSVVAGSVFVRIIAANKDNPAEMKKKITEKAKEITGR